MTARAHRGSVAVRASAGAVDTAPALFMHPPRAIRFLPGINTRVCSGNSPIVGKFQTRRSTAVTLPRIVAWVPSIGS